VSDTRIRQLERQRDGTPEAEAAYLRARIRCGSLTRERLELAAYCGDEGARLALACEDPHPCDVPRHHPPSRFPRLMIIHHDPKPG